MANVERDVNKHPEKSWPLTNPAHQAANPVCSAVAADAQSVWAPRA